MDKAIIILPTDSFISTTWIKSKVERKCLNPHFFFLDQNCHLSKKQIIKKINEVVKKQEINFSFFQGDYISLIDYDFITKINCSKKYLYLTDDFDMHEVNTLTALACDGIISGCPISVFKYKEKNLNAYFVIHESDERVYKNLNINKDIDVIFFGTLKADRINFIDKLKENKINLKIVGPADNNSALVSNEELNKLINRSKIVLNFSSTGYKNKFYSHKTFAFNYLILKGRVMISGLCGSLCISEHAPAHKLIFKEDALPEFKDAEEMITKIKYFLNDENALKNQTTKFANACKSYSDEVYMNNLFKNLILKSHRKKVNKFPFWYLRTFYLKHTRLYGKNRYLLSYILNTTDNLCELFKFKNYLNLVIIFETIVYLPLMIIKILFNKLKIDKN